MIYIVTVVAIAISVLACLFFRSCACSHVPSVMETEPELDEVEEGLYRYLEPVFGTSKAKTIDMVESVTELFHVNEVNFTTNDVLGFVRTVREWDRSVGRLDQKDTEYMYNNINCLNIDSELFDIIVTNHIKTCTSKPYTVLFKRILKQLTDEAIEGELFNVLFN